MERLRGVESALGRGKGWQVELLGAIDVGRGRL